MKGQEHLVWKNTPTLCKAMEKDKITPEELKQCLIECFTTALGGDGAITLTTLKKQAIEVGMDWERPTKEGIVMIMNRLKSIALKFRDREVVESNYRKMMQLVARCEEITK
jgi:hypothetical protein